MRGLDFRQNIFSVQCLYKLQIMHSYQHNSHEMKRKSNDIDEICLKKSTKYLKTSNCETAEELSVKSNPKISNEEEAFKFEYPWLPNRDLSEDLKDEKYMPQGDIVANMNSDDSTMERFDNHIITFMKEQNIPGLSVCISRKGIVIYTQSYGWATKNVRLETKHMFRIASVSKLLTAIGVLHLYEKGKLSTATRVFGKNGILSDFSLEEIVDKRILKITVKHLLQHSGGWDRDIAGDPVYYTAKEIGLEPGVIQPAQLTNYMLKQKLQFRPGSRYAYSNFGYLLLGLILEQVSGVAYEQYMSGLLNACSLFGMVLAKTRHSDKHPFEVDYFSGPGVRMIDSVFAGEEKVDAAYGSFCLETAKSYGGWVATPTHLVQLSHELELGHLLQPKLVKKMKMKPNFCKEKLWYGMGVDVQFNGKHYEHSGMIDGATSILTNSSDGYTWAVCCNYWPSDVDYNSVIQYGLCLVNGWTNITPIIKPPFHGVTNTEKSAICLQLTYEEFLKKNNIASTEGYRINCINIYSYQELLYFNAMWVNDNEDSQFFIDCDVANISDIFNRQKCNGYVPTHIELYELNGKLKCCIIFVKCKKNVRHTIKKNINVEEELLLMSGEGYTPFLLCVHIIGEEQWIAMLYEPNNKRTWVKTCMSKEEYKSNVAKHSHYGHMPVYLRIHRDDKGPLYSALWSDPGKYLYTTDYEMSKFRLLHDFVSLNDQNFMPHCISGYESEASHKYAAVFVKELRV